jgi:uncharacterized protein
MKPEKEEIKMERILVERPDKSSLEEMGVTGWPVWEKEVSRFDWTYDEKETCYILAGHARVEPENAEAVEFGPGDMVIFPDGRRCVWEITSPIKKHYKFG